MFCIRVLSIYVALICLYVQVSCTRKKRSIENLNSTIEVELATSLVIYPAGTYTVMLNNGLWCLCVKLKKRKQMVTIKLNLEKSRCSDYMLDIALLMLFLKMQVLWLHDRSFTIVTTPETNKRCVLFGIYMCPCDKISCNLIYDF
jgi:hypothetical protein